MSTEHARTSNVLPFPQRKIPATTTPASFALWHDLNLEGHPAFHDARVNLLARQLERMLIALLHHTREKDGSGLLSKRNRSLYERIEYLFPKDCLLAIARAAIQQQWDTDLAKLGAVVIAITLSAWRRPWIRLKVLLVPRQRYGWRDLQALASALAPDIRELHENPLSRWTQTLSSMGQSPDVKTNITRLP